MPVHAATVSPLNVHHIPALVFQAGSHAQLAGEALSSGCELDAVADFAVDHGLPQRSLGGVMNEFDAVYHPGRSPGLIPQPGSDGRVSTVLAQGIFIASGKTQITAPWSGTEQAVQQLGVPPTAPVTGEKPAGH